MINDEIKILNVKINPLKKINLLSKIKNLLTVENSQPSHLITTNPEFIIDAQKNEAFKRIINHAWLSVADGYGIKLAAQYNYQLSSLGYRASVIKKILIGVKIAWWGVTRNQQKLTAVPDIITGTDLIPEICQLVNDENLSTKIFLVGGFGNVPKLVADNLKQKFSHLTIACSIFEEDNLIDQLNDFKPQIIFVALNHPRAQFWIAENMKSLQSVKLAIGVGGAFDYLSGNLKRAPVGWRQSFEWFFRLLKQPKRIKRIWHAVVVFPWLVFKNSLK